LFILLLIVDNGLKAVPLGKVALRSNDGRVILLPGSNNNPSDGFAASSPAWEP